MKVKLESSGIDNRGILLISETAEEIQILTSLWIDKGRPAMFERTVDHVEIIIAPTCHIPKEIPIIGKEEKC